MNKNYNKVEKMENIKVYVCFSLTLLLSSSVGVIFTRISTIFLVDFFHIKTVLEKIDDFTLSFQKFLLFLLGHTM